jgi:hypothetical protein
MSLHLAAQHIAAKGRGPDSTLVHMSKGEVKSLQDIARANGGSLSINPDTGLVEAGFLSSILPMVAGAALTATGVGAPMAALMVGGASALMTGNLSKGIMAGLGAYGGGNLGEALASQGVEQATQAKLAESELYKQQMAEAANLSKQGLTPDKFAAQAQDITGRLGQTIEGARSAVAPTDFAGKLGAMGQGVQTLGQTGGVSNLWNALGSGKEQFGTVAGLASPMLASEEQAPTKMPSGPNPYKYTFNPNVTTPLPQPDVPGYGNQNQNFGREQRYFSGQYVPVETTTQMAGGGPVEAMSNANAIGANTGFPMANISRGAYATPWQTPVSQNVVSGAADTGVNPYTGQERFAAGGVTGEGQLDLHIPLDLGGSGGGGFGQGPNNTGLNINQGPLDLGRNNTGFGQASSNGYKAAGSGMGSGTSITGQPLVGSTAAGLSGLLTPAQVSSFDLSQLPNDFNLNPPSQKMLGSSDSLTPGAQNPFAPNYLNHIRKKDFPSFDEFKNYGMKEPGDSIPTEAQYQEYLAQRNSRPIATADMPMSREDYAAFSNLPQMRKPSYVEEQPMQGGTLGQLAGMASGGMTSYNLGGYSDGGRLLRGPGDGVSDSIPATIGNKQPARLADGEFVVPARIVSELGNGSTEAGARKLYAMMDRVQNARKKTIGKGKVAHNSKAEKYLPA